MLRFRLHPYLHSHIPNLPNHLQDVLERSRSSGSGPPGRPHAESRRATTGLIQYVGHLADLGNEEGPAYFSLAFLAASRTGPRLRRREALVGVS